MDTNLDYQTYNLYIGIIGACAAIIVPVILHNLQKKEKRLAFEKFQNLSVTNIDDSFKEEIEIRYANKLINNLFVLKAHIKNNGSLSIKEEDIKKPIKITFKERVIKCNVIGSNPPGVEADLKITNDENSVECIFNLLNPRDYITLQFISLEKLSTPTIVSRIDGLSQVKIISIYDIDPNDHNLRNCLNILPKFFESKLSKPLYFFTLPGLVLIITGSYMFFNFVQNYIFGGHLRFGPTLLMIILVIIGVFMTFTGIILYSISNSISSSLKNMGLTRLN